MSARTCRRALAAGIAAGAAALSALGTPVVAGAAPDVVGQWRFDEPAGAVAFDDGPYGLDGQLGAGAGAEASDPERVDGQRGRALHFGGAGFVRLPHAMQLEPATLSVEAVVRGDESPGRFRYLVAHGAEACIAGSYGLYTGDAGGIAFYVFDGDSFVISAGAAPADVWDGAWHHVAAAFDGVALRLYVDGHPVGAPQPAPLSIAYALTSNDTYFGMYRGSCALPLHGDVDLVRLWSSALGPVTVAQLSDEALTPAPPSGPVPDPDHPGGPVVPPPGGGLPDVPPGASDPPDGASPRTPLVPATPGTTTPAPSQPKGGDGSPPTSAPGAPPRACAVRSSVRRVRARRVSVVTVRVSLRGQPLHRVRVVATQGAARRVVASARTARNGRARLRVRPLTKGKIRLAVPSRRDCGTAALTVVSR